MTSVWFEGLDDLNRVIVDLDAAGSRAGKQVEQVVRRVGLAVEGTAKQFAPVDTGALRSSIGADFRTGMPGWQEAEIGPTVEYGQFVEHGTSRMSPRSYLGPALDRHSAEFVDALTAIADPLNT